MQRECFIQATHNKYQLTDVWSKKLAMRAEVTLSSPKPIKCKRNSTGDKNLRYFSLRDVPGYIITNKRD